MEAAVNQEPEQQNSSFLDFGLDEVPELTHVDEGEYNLILLRAEVKGPSPKNGRNYIVSRHQVEGVPEAKVITNNTWLPGPNDSDADRIKTLNDYRRFLRAHGIPTSGPQNPAEWTDAGYQAYAFVTVEESGEYGTQNRIARWIEGA